jgi:nucleoside-diphosphate-sugar epimerase
MKVFVAGGTGAVGKRLVPLLVAGGYEVVAMTRSREREVLLRALGAQPVVADGLDRAAVMRAVLRAEPEVVIHEMTGSEAKTEEDAFDPEPPPNQRQTLAAIRYLEGKVVGCSDLDGIALRHANHYGPGTSFALDGDLIALVPKRQLPIIGDGAGVWAFIHVDDLAQATIAAIERARSGIYNIVDDHPAPAAEWIPALAEAVGAKPPRRVPIWLGRLAAGEVGVSMMTQIRRGLERQGQTGTRLETRLPELPRGLPRRPRANSPARADRAHARHRLTLRAGPQRAAPRSRRRRRP